VIEQNKKYKIAIVAYNLNTGGLAKVIINIFSLLSKVGNVDVSLLLLDNEVEYEVLGKVINFGVHTGSNNTCHFKKIKKYILFKNYLKKQKFDFIIDLRYRINPISEIFITKFLYPRTKIIYTVHSSKIDTYLLDSTFLTKWLYGKSYKIVCVAEANEKKVILRHQLKNTLTIYNPIDFEEIDEKSNEEIEFDFEYIVAVGRVVALKQFDKFIEAYSKSILINKNVKLVIIGDGTDFEKIDNLIKKMNLTNDVYLIGNSNNPYKYMKRAKYLVLCSQYEGFPLVLLESLATGVPVISFNLDSGPNEIINHQYNGLLVKNQSFEELTNAIDLLFNDKKLYHTCKLNAKSSVLQFSLEGITKDWLNLMQIK
jgi:glycosyltransferase involved in cell wall biosynthesis